MELQVYNTKDLSTLRFIIILISGLEFSTTTKLSIYYYKTIDIIQVYYIPHMFNMNIYVHKRKAFIY